MKLEMFRACAFLLHFLSESVTEAYRVCLIWLDSIQCTWIVHAGCEVILANRNYSVSVLKTYIFYSKAWIKDIKWTTNENYLDGESLREVGKANKVCADVRWNYLWEKMRAWRLNLSCYQINERNVNISWKLTWCGE